MKKSIIYNLSILLNILVLIGLFFNLVLYKNLIFSKILFITCICNLVIDIIYTIIRRGYHGED